VGDISQLLAPRPRKKTGYRRCCSMVKRNVINILILPSLYIFLWDLLCIETISVHNKVQSLYGSTPEFIQVGEHQFIPRKLVEMWVGWYVCHAISWAIF
jgi:hypothetical protein